MTSGNVLCFAIRANQFRRANDHFTFGRVRIRLGRKIGWQLQEWLALKQFGILNFVHLCFTNVKQSKLNFRI